MKTNEAPEKIYLYPSDRTGGGYEDEWGDIPWGDSVEYVRTDAFIEKVCEFLKSYRQDTIDGTGYIAGIVNDKTIEDLKNYMKGE